jgi:hypothetical protein
LYHVIIILISFYIVFQYLATTWPITGFVTRLTRCVPLVEQELLPEHLSSPPVLVGFVSMFCRWLFVLLSFFFWPLCCLFFFDLRILITPLVSSSSSYMTIFQWSLGRSYKTGFTVNIIYTDKAGRDDGS